MSKLQKLWQGLRRHLDDILIPAGCISIVIFTYKVNPTASWLVGGIMLIVLGVMAGLEARK